jgi:putative tricarboxylic transport membrane protein
LTAPEVRLARDTDPPSAAAPRRGRIRSPRDFLAGASLVAVAAFALWASAPLDSGTLRFLGPGMLPRAVAIAVGLAGVIIALVALVKGDAPLGRWPLRGPLFVSLAVLAFALSIRTVGLALAGPLVVVIGGAASPESRPRELVVFAVVMTALCIGLFRYALSLPIPVLYLPGLVTL